jgi:hypothetical protein
MAYYKRGRARFITGDYRGTVTDMSAMLELPFGKGLDTEYQSSTVALLKKLREQGRGVAHLRRAAALAFLKDWPGVLDDTKFNSSPLSYELKGLAFDGLDMWSAAIESYEATVKEMVQAKYYGPEDFDDQFEENAWRLFKQAYLKVKIATDQVRLGQLDEASATYASAGKLLQDAYTSPDITMKTRNLADALASHIPKSN